jgi:PAS domain S-box-containing protein
LSETSEARAAHHAPPVDDRLDTLPCGVLSFADDGTVLSANSTLAGMLGYERSEIEGRHVETFLTVSGRIFFQTHLYPIIRLHGRANELFVLMRRKDGGDVGALINAVRVQRDGRAVIECAVLEIQERRKLEDALLRAKRESEAANAALAARTRELEEANERLEQQAVELELQQQQLQEQTTELEMQSEELLRTNDQLAAHAEELERARQAAEDANRAKSQFLAVMSHELRTPLNAIGGYTQLLELGVHGPITDAQRDALERVTRAQRHLLRLINEVLNLARIEAGRVEYTLEDVPVADVVAGVMPMVEPQMATAQLTSSADVPPGLVARADREKLQQILINLLTNAVKFTPAGGTIRVQADVDRQRNLVRIDVIDSGIGIPAEKLAGVFEPFVQVDVSHTRRREGSGLGLAISRDLARGMGGDLVAESEEGRGSTFTLLLPRKR